MAARRPALLAAWEWPRQSGNRAAREMALQIISGKACAKAAGSPSYRCM